MLRVAVGLPPDGWKVCVVADVPLPSAVPSSELLNAVQPVNASTPAHAAAATAAARRRREDIMPIIPWLSRHLKRVGPQGDRTVNNG